jgi:hypothetical protein
MNAGRTTRCIGCGGLVPLMEGPTHPYMESSPGCWHIFGQLLAHQFAEPSSQLLRRLTADSFAVQHPGHPSPQATNSVCVHLISLCLIVEQARTVEYAERVMAEAIRTQAKLFWLAPPASLGAVTVADLAAIEGSAHDDVRVRAWAESAWSAWTPHHATVRSWLPA